MQKMANYHETLGTEKISKLLFRQSSPAIIGLLVVSLYNFVDAIFIGQGVGPLGIAGLSVSWPIQMIIMAFAQTVGVGSASIISRSIGAKNFKKAEQTLGNFFTLIVIVSVLVSVLGLLFINPLLQLFGATEAILPYAVDYTGIILLGIVFLSFASASNNIIRAEGNAKFAMIIMITSAMLNMILDPIFIFGFNMGMKGAALATFIGYFSAASFAFYYFVKGKSGIKIHLKNLKPKLKIIKETFAIGASSFARQSATSIMVIIINRSLVHYGGDLTIAAYGIVVRVLMMVFMPMYGIVQGFQPILGYNYGAKKYKRAKEVILKAIKAASLLGFFAFIILFVFAEPIVQIFTSDPELTTIASKAMRIIILALPIIGFQTVAGGLYQSIGKAAPAFFISILRQVVLLLPLVLIIPLFLGLNGIWIAIPIADFIAAIVIFFMLYRELKKFN